MGRRADESKARNTPCLYHHPLQTPIIPVPFCWFGPLSRSLRSPRTIPPALPFQGRAGGSGRVTRPDVLRRVWAVARSARARPREGDAG